MLNKLIVGFLFFLCGAAAIAELVMFAVAVFDMSRNEIRRCLK